MRLTEGYCRKQRLGRFASTRQAHGRLTAGTRQAHGRLRAHFPGPVSALLWASGFLCVSEPVLRPPSAAFKEKKASQSTTLSPTASTLACLGFHCKMTSLKYAARPCSPGCQLHVARVALRPANVQKVGPKTAAPADAESGASVGHASGSTEICGRAAVKASQGGEATLSDPPQAPCLLGPSW